MSTYFAHAVRKLVAEYTLHEEIKGGKLTLRKGFKSVEEAVDSLPTSLDPVSMRVSVFDLKGRTILKIKGEVCKRRRAQIAFIDHDTGLVVQVIDFGCLEHAVDYFEKEDLHFSSKFKAVLQYGRFVIENWRQQCA